MNVLIMLNIYDVSLTKGKIITICYIPSKKKKLFVTSIEYNTVVYMKCQNRSMRYNAFKANLIQVNNTCIQPWCANAIALYNTIYIHYHIFFISCLILYLHYGIIIYIQGSESDSSCELVQRKFQVTSTHYYYFYY